MWGLLEKGKELAKKAEKAALDIDKKINESVGIVETTTTITTPHAAAEASHNNNNNNDDDDDNDDDALNATWVDDAFASDDDDDDTVDLKNKKSNATQDRSAAAEVQQLEKKASIAAKTKAPPEAAPPAPPEVPSSEKSFSKEDEQPLRVSPEEDATVAASSSPQSQHTVILQAVVPADASESHDATENNANAWAEDDLEIVLDDDDDVVDNAVTDGTDSEKQPATQQATPATPLSVSTPSAAPRENDMANVDTSREAATAVEAVPDESPMKQLEPNDVMDRDSLPTDTNAADITTTTTPSPITDEIPVPANDEHDSTSRWNQLDNGSKELLQRQQQTRQQALERQLQELQSLLQKREDQLLSKTEQLTTMEAMHESETAELQQRVQDTKDEAKRRILKAKERVQAMEKAAAAAAAAAANKISSGEDASKQAEIIAALRQEGETLARKQSEMVQAVRTAKAEARELEQDLQQERSTKENALETVARLQNELKTTREELASARRGESQADKLELELSKAREEGETKAASILTLEQNIKELWSENKELTVQLEEAQKGAAIETEREQKKLRRERNDAVSDLENKLRTSEREAAVREDALRHEVAELRKRWQDAVRRADSLSMDVQSSTAPLLRQLESADRQNRARAAAWAELENSLRAELEENVIANEKLSKERSEWKTKFTRLERATNDKEAELKSARRSLDEKTQRVKQLEAKLETMEVEGSKMKEEWAEVERLANEGVSRVRSEMTQTVVENEERHQSQLESLQAELQEERDKCVQLRRQVDELVEKSGLLVPQEVLPQPSISVPDDKPKKLVQSIDQVDILTGALNGIGDSPDDEHDDDEDVILAHSDGTSSFAALAELTSRLKSANVELITLRQSLAESEKSRETMVEELADARNAREKLPLFETRVQELTSENERMSLEIQSLQLDIADVRELYRMQLNVLLEEKAAENANAIQAGEAKDPSTSIQAEPLLSDS